MNSSFLFFFFEKELNCKNKIDDIYLFITFLASSSSSYYYCRTDIIIFFARKDSQLKKFEILEM